MPLQSRGGSPIDPVHETRGFTTPHPSIRSDGIRPSGADWLTPSAGRPSANLTKSLNCPVNWHVIEQAGVPVVSLRKVKEPMPADPGLLLLPSWYQPGSDSTTWSICRFRIGGLQSNPVAQQQADLVQHLSCIGNLTSQPAVDIQSFV